MSDKSWEPELSLSHSLTLDMLNNFCFHVYAQKSLSLSHSLTFTLSHYHTLTLSHFHTLSFSRHAEQVLFSCLGSKFAAYSRKLQCFFGDLLSLITLSCEFRSHRAGSQLKIGTPSMYTRITFQFHKSSWVNEQGCR